MATFDYGPSHSFSSGPTPAGGTSHILNGLARSPRAPRAAGGMISVPTPGAPDLGDLADEAGGPGEDNGTTENFEPGAAHAASAGDSRGHYPGEPGYGHPLISGKLQPPPWTGTLTNSDPTLKEL